MKKRFFFLIVGVLTIALVGCSDEQENDKVKANTNFHENEKGADVKKHFVFNNYIENLYADDLNGKQISMEAISYISDEGEIVQDDYIIRDILRIGKTQDSSGVLTFDFEAARYDNSILKISNVTLNRMSYDGTTFTATHPEIPGFEFETSAEIDLKKAREYFENYSFKESTNKRFVEILSQDLDYFKEPVVNVKETANGYIGIHKGQFEFIGGPLKGSVGDITIQVSLDKEYNFTGMKRVMASDGKSLNELTINVTDFK